MKNLVSILSSLTNKNFAENLPLLFVQSSVIFQRHNAENILYHRSKGMNGDFICN